MIRELTFVVRTFLLTCDNCGHSFPEQPCESRYASPGQAWSDAVQVDGWTRTTGRELCALCSCARLGHRWLDWVIRVPAHLGETAVEPFRFCRRCGVLEIWGQGVIGDD